MRFPVFEDNSRCKGTAGARQLAERGKSMKSGGILLVAIGLWALGAQAQDVDTSHACVREITKWVSFKDPESIRVMSLTGPEFEAIDYANTRLLAYKFTLMVNSKNVQGGYTGARPYTCWTSEDRQRVLKYSPTRD
jgi:hypothetical protein